MSFGGFGGFGQNNNQSSGGGFGGFGSNNNNTSGGFGSSNTNTGFGASGGGSLFGNNNQQQQSTGSTFGGFGSSGGNAFGQNKTGFGSTATTSGGGLFGSSTATSGGFGGFGNTNNQASSGFGTSNTSTGGLFGQQNKPATTGFGSSGSLFGSGGAAGGFGSSTTQPAATSGFGGFGGSTAQNNGTGSQPFSEVTEKDANSAGNQMNKFQSITTMDAYKNFSFEELRTVDYQQNRKQGSANGQAGSFGAGTTFGGFGSNNTTNTTGGFGASNTGTTSLFGNNNTTSTGGGFGASTSGGLFGQNKPATTGLFGSSATTSAPAGGSLFGTSGTTGGFGTGFGSNNTSAATTGGLFGTANQAKPAFGGFGSGTTGGFGASTGGGFGSNTQTTTATGGLFGNNNNTSGGFGQTQQPASTGFSFGQQNNQTAQPAQTGGLFGSGGFGQQNNNQPKPSLFGSTTQPAAGSSLFGNNNQQPQQTTSLFGNTQNNQQQSGGLFGAPKPAGTSLFGNTNTGASTGLFGNNNQQQSTGGLFGNNNQQQSGGLFGAKPAGSSLFGNTQQNNQPAGGGLFGNSQQNAQQPAQQSLFGGSLTNTTTQQTPGQLNASLMQNPYGNDALFANIGSPTASVGPVATPLAKSTNNKKQALIPAYKISPAASSRLTTPQKRPAGYGFSYSTYGTPGSAIAGSPFGFSNALSPAFGRSLNKSMSTSSLRNSFTAEESILNPAAFSSTVRGGTGRLKKLNVDRSLNSARKPLFAPATPEPRKSVSFDTSNGRKDSNGSLSLDSTNGALVPRTESPTSSPETATNGASNGRNGLGKELAVVPEDTSPPGAPAVKPPVQAPRSHADQAPGGYYSKPSIEEIKNMSRSQAQNYKDFKVGCKNSGEITFSQVDLTSIPFDKLFGDIVTFKTRSVAVYGDDTTVPKPPRGQGLNVPSIITLANSWPRSHAGATEVLEKKGPRFEKHINRLKRIADTEFVNYNRETGEWTFKVQHYTTYGLPEDDDDMDESMMDESMLSPNLASPTPLKVAKLREQHSSPTMASDASLPSPPDSSPDDTFDFKKGKRKQLPGQFDDEAMADEFYEEDVEEEEVTGSLSFLGQRSVGSSVADIGEETQELVPVEEEQDLEMAGSFPVTTDRTTEQQTMPKSILKNSTMQLPQINGGTPFKTGSVFFGDDWTEQLQRTVSPRKQDRAKLRASQGVAVAAQPEREEVKGDTPKAAKGSQPFATSMDIMNELFGQSTRGGRNSGVEVC